MEDVIDPRETRPLLCEFARLAEGRIRSGPLGPKPRYGVSP